MLKRQNKEQDDVSLEEHVLAVQQGDEETRHHLLTNYQPFIATCVSKVCKRYIDPEKDDEYSVGLMAFNEAIESYSENKGSSFLSFARLVISRKVIDYIRSVNKEPIHVSLDYSDSDDSNDGDSYWIVSEAAKEAYHEDETAWYRRVEIEEYSKKLQEYKLSFSELVQISPKHHDARESAKKIAKFVYHNQEIKEYVLEKKRLPIKKILPHVDVSKKTIERNRKYILAIFILLHEEFVFLKDYVKGVE
ncbi:RNA polymerase sigma-I factor [Bacillaceae bacterium W0354]